MRHTSFAARSGAFRFASFSFAVFCGLAFSAVAHATPLPVGAAIPSSNVPGLAGGGLLVANTGPLPFASPTFTGTMQSEAFLNDPANPFGPGNITFTYLITNTAGPDSIDRFTINGYGVPGLLTDASYQAPTVGVLPASFDRSVAATLGDVIGVSYVDAPLGFGTVSPGSAERPRGSPHELTAGRPEQRVGHRQHHCIRGCPGSAARGSGALGDRSRFDRHGWRGRNCSPQGRCLMRRPAI